MTLTVLFILLFAAFIIAVVTVFDVWTIRARGADTSISWLLLTGAQRQPIIAWAIGLGMGVLAAHFFWTNTP